MRLICIERSVQGDVALGYSIRQTAVMFIFLLKRCTLNVTLLHSVCCQTHDEGKKKPNTNRAPLHLGRTDGTTAEKSI